MVDVALGVPIVERGDRGKVSAGVFVRELELPQLGGTEKGIALGCALRVGVAQKRIQLLNVERVGAPRVAGAQRVIRAECVGEMEATARGRAYSLR